MSTTTHIEDYQELIDEPKKRNAFFKRIYNDTSLRNQIFRKVLDMGVNREEAEEVFQETIIIFDQKIREGKVKAKSKLSTFLVGIAINVCRNKKKSAYKRKRKDDDTIWEKLVYDKQPDNRIAERELKKNVQLLMNTLESECKDILTYWQYNYAMSWIAKAMNLASASAARKKKFRCVKKLQKIIEKNTALEKYMKELWMNYF